MLLTTREVATLLRVHPKHVYRLLRRGLPARRVGGEWRFVREEVLAWGGAGATPAEPDAPRLLAANEDLVVDLLLGRLRAKDGPLMGRIPADSRGGLELLARGAVAVAGYHGGERPASPPGLRLVGLHLFERELGLVFPRRRGAPRLADVTRVRFASRPEGAGSRVLLDAALRRQGLAPEQLDAELFSSPRDVACAVARGDADAGISTRAWSARLGLGFKRLAVEDYVLLIDSKQLGEPAVVRLCEAVQAPDFARLVRQIPGCDPRGAGVLSFPGA